MKLITTTLLLTFSILAFGQSELKKEVQELPRFYTAACEKLKGSSMEKMQCANQALMQFITNNLKYPTKSKVAKIEGTAMVKFIVSKEGKVKDIEVNEAPSQEMGVEAVRVLNLMNEQNQNWVAGLVDGKKVDVQLMLPFKFKL